MIGTLVAGKYRLDRKMGQGGFGLVYCGLDVNLKREVAVKMLHGYGPDEKFRRRFERESEMTASLMHPNIATVFDFGEHEGKPYLVLEFVNGPTLRQMAESRKLSLGEILKISLQVCSAMAFAHSQGIVHRDLSMNNIMINESNDVKIVDFGLARLLDQDSNTSSRIDGTPYYLAPELFTGAVVDHRVDVFAFGVCLYRLLNGRFPFDAEHRASVIYQIINEPNIEFAEEVPGRLRAIVLKCLEKDPSNRYRDFSVLGDDLAGLQHACLESTLEIPVAVRSPRRSSKRNPYLNRVMVKDPSDFYGRQREVAKIYSRLDAPHPQSISVVGDRKIGKSSLLNFVYNHKNRKRFMRNTYTDAMFIYVDLQRAIDLTVSMFIGIVSGMLRLEERSTFASLQEPKTLDDLKDMVQAATENGKRIIILMDEFDSITKNRNFEMQFFSFLRFLANNYKVAYVTSSHTELQLLCHDKDIADSPFFNIFTNLPLRPFSGDEANELISTPSEREGIPLGRYAGRILAMSGYFPMYIQIACSAVFEYLVEHRGSKPDWDAVAGAFGEEVSPHYAFVWDKLDENSQETMARVAMGRRIGDQYKHISDDLLRRGYLIQSDGGTSIFSDSFRDFVLKTDRCRGGRTGGFWGFLGRGSR
jgi:serine/threonine protein kinase